MTFQIVLIFYRIKISCTYLKTIIFQMSKLIACFLSVFLFSCNSENESISLANAVQSQELQTFDNNHKLMETAPSTDSTIKYFTWQI